MISITQTAHCMYMVWYFNLALFYELSKCVISSYLYFSMANAKWCLICDRQIKATKYMSLDFASATLKREPAFLDFLGDMVGDEIDIFAPHMSQYMCGTCHLMVMKCINVKTLQETIRYKFHKTTAKHILSTSSETLLNTALLIPPPCNPPEVDLLRAKVAQRKALESPRTPLPRKDDQQDDGQSVESFNVKIENSVSHETHEGRPKTVKKDKCAAFGCTHKKSKSRCAFYSFPRYSKANKKWIKASRCNLSKDGFTKKKNFSSRNLRLCECHFARVPYPRSSSQRLKNIAPTLFNFLAADFKASSKPVKRVKRIPIMSAKPLEKPTSPENNCRPSFYQQMKHFLSKEAYDAVDSCAPSFWKTYHQLEKEVMTLKATCNSTTVLSLQNIKCNDRVFETYTGLPNYATFEVLCGYMAMNASCLWRFKALPFGELTVIDTNNVNRQTLTIEDQLFLFLVAVRTGSSSKDLAIRFSISERLVNNIISSWAVFVSDTLEKFYNTTVTKKAKFNVAVDYTALFSESPALLTTQQNETTINRRLIAVGFSRYGVVTSVLSTKRGHALARVSTTHNEGTDSASKQPSSLGPVKHEQGTKILPSSSQPGDVSSLVITEDLSKSHMTPMSTAEVFHVERALNRIKQFHYLQKQVEPSMEDMYEQVFKACAFLVNFQSVS
ncbi:uncharacterized protein LOC117289136 isoform X9 [Asterias rubens]|uniref:uncharacterized protein LOC117289136 isoform X9 n=1 Tax=Asterias rubens TaxID=7604 RepID=UPI00145505CD|nr:uncharacterized protein LOC117289136 isoform X9 [Asterias rubens]